MKEQYMTPTIETVNIELGCMIASSVRIYDSNSGGDDNEGGYNPGTRCPKSVVVAGETFGNRNPA